MFFVYIIYSPILGKYYVGYSENVKNRLEFHNDLLRNKIWTKRGIPWELYATLSFSNKKEALQAERFIKNQKSRKFIERIISSGWESI